MIFANIFNLLTQSGAKYDTDANIFSVGPAEMANMTFLLEQQKQTQSVWHDHAPSDIDPFGRGDDFL